MSEELAEVEEELQEKGLVVNKEDNTNANDSGIEKSRNMSVLAEVARRTTRRKPRHCL